MQHDFPLEEFWQYTSTYREQPEVNFLDRVILQVSGNGCINAWSSYPDFNDLLENEEIMMPLIEVSKQHNCSSYGM